MGPTVDSTMTSLDVKIPLLHIELEVRAVEHHSVAE